MKNKTFTIRLQVREADFINTTAEEVEIYFGDLLKKAVLPALNLDLVPLSLEVKKARK
jgi:tRNA(Ser,Leu) C12 N-acetylase TAN1